MTKATRKKAPAATKDKAPPAKAKAKKPSKPKEKPLTRKKAPAKKAAPVKRSARSTPPAPPPPAPLGNQFWRLRTKHGRDKLFSSAAKLWEACVEYFVAVEANPLIENKVSNGFIVRVPKIRAMTIGGLCIFLDIGRSTWDDYKNKEQYADFSEVITRVEEIIRDQKFGGAAADLLNANIIARDLGLAEKHIQEDTGALPYAERLRRIRDLEQQQ